MVTKLVAIGPRTMYMEIHFQATSDIYKSYMFVNVDRHAKHKTQTKK